MECSSAQIEDEEAMEYPARPRRRGLLRETFGFTFAFAIADKKQSKYVAYGV